jgi:hypothetical protein
MIYHPANLMNTMQKKHEREMAVKEKQKPDIERLELERPQGERLFTSGRL